MRCGKKIYFAAGGGIVKTVLLVLLFVLLTILKVIFPPGYGIVGGVQEAVFGRGNNQIVSALGRSLTSTDEREQLRETLKYFFDTDTAERDGLPQDVYGCGCCSENVC